MKPSQAVEQFEIPGRLIYVNAITRGNVNDTYEAAFREGGDVHRVILQRINRHVFQKPEWIMSNMRAVTDHIGRKIQNEYETANREWGFPKLVPARTGDDYFLDESDNFWRVISKIDAASSYSEIRDAEHATEAGAVLGCFHRLISDIDSEGLYDTLPGYHVCPRYLTKYDHTLGNGCVASRVGLTREVKRLQTFIQERRELAHVLQEALDDGVLSMQPVHGDPKVDNIMIDDFTGKGIGMVDLDTVKPGLIHYDFGDALRSACNPAGEDATDLKEVVFDIDLCRAFVRGYMRQAGDFLTDGDRYYLFEAVHLLAFELGLRFFEDYLAGDKYFKVRFEEHNLNRARVQFKLCESVELNEPAIREAIEQG